MDYFIKRNKELDIEIKKLDKQIDRINKTFRDNNYLLCLYIDENKRNRERKKNCIIKV